jgi:glyoxalase family protein
MGMDLTGLHHLTAVSAAIRENYRFYTRVMGMRLVKRSVNQDDVSAYHLFYADNVGTPGTDLTFFDWKMPREARGTNSIVRTHLRVAGEPALAYWTDRLAAHGVVVSPIRDRGGRRTIDFDDPEGQRLALVDDGGAGDAPQLWREGPVPAEFQVRGLGPVVLSVSRAEGTHAILTQALNMRLSREYTDPDDEQALLRVYEMGAGGPHAELHVATQPGLARARLGAGGVHHVALRTPNEETYHAWTARLTSLGVPHSGEIDRFYFRSLYFREPGGILFEIATDGPGFAVDEDVRALGYEVALPPFLEGRRTEIVAKLEPLD